MLFGVIASLHVELMSEEEREVVRDQEPADRKKAESSETVPRFQVPMFEGRNLHIVRSLRNFCFRATAPFKLNLFRA